jgi:plastocyanin
MAFARGGELDRHKPEPDGVVQVIRKLILGLALVLALSAAAPATTATTTVQITKLGFVPKDITVTQGDQVTWQNSDTVNHQVVSQASGFASPILKPNETYAHVFDKTGKVTYVDPLVKNTRGTVTVNAAPVTATLAASSSLVVFGGRATVSGQLSNKLANEKVDIYKAECGAAQVKMDTVTTTTDGNYSLVVQPLKNTAYQAKYKTTTASPSPTVHARPRITLAKVAPQRFTVRTFAAQSFAGKIAVLQRFNKVLGTWVKVRTATLRANTSGVAPTVVSSVTLTAKVKAKTKLRIVLPQTQVGSCYLAGTSNAILA